MTDLPPEPVAAAAAAHGTHDHDDDPRNAQILINVNGRLVPRGQAVVSVFDAGFSLGDGVWEGFRVHGEQLPFADAHLDRLFWGAGAIRLDIGLTREELHAALRETIDANGMVDGVHVRLMVTRGTKPHADAGSAHVGRSGDTW